MFTKRARRELFLIAVLLLAGQLFYIIFYHDSGYRQLMSRRSELQRLQLESESLVQEQRVFEERIHRLEHDPQFFEDFIRDRYPYAKRGDIIVNIQKPRR
jgi:cell division protein FtsB